MTEKSLILDKWAPEALTVLYEDNHLLAVLKPAGILVQGDRSGDPSLMDAAKQYIKNAYGKPGEVFLGLVHRLDRPVSGVVLFARTSKAASRLSRQWRARSVVKIYWALVHGAMKPHAGVLTSYLKEGARRVQAASAGEPGVKEAVLSYRTLRARGPFSLVEIHLHTGRKHQIRVQLARAGCPVVGDVRYGAPRAPEPEQIRLTARSLTFTHPTRNETLTIEAPPPDWATSLLDVSQSL